MMFGADTALVLDALQMAAVIAAAAGGMAYLALRKPLKGKAQPASAGRASKTNLEERVEVLERIATDRSLDLAEEIEALREAPARTKMKEQPQ
jgi:hypothetical protein